MPKFVEGFADTLQVPPGVKDAQVFDSELPGFGIRKYAKGHATYFVKYQIGQKQRRLTLGRVVRGNLKAMRLQALEILAIDLRLLALQGAQTQIGFGLWMGTMARNNVAEVVGPAGVRAMPSASIPRCSSSPPTIASSPAP